jgi:hypothetical protein
MRAIVIDETIRCIFEEGFAAASAKHITERAGVTWGVVQYHFGAATGHALRRRGGRPHESSRRAFSKSVLYIGAVLASPQRQSVLEKGLR